jgi:hypothetical protein
VQRGVGTLDRIAALRRLDRDPQDRVRELEDESVLIKRKLLSVPEMDRRYAYRMRVSVDEVLSDIRNILCTERRSN